MWFKSYQQLTTTCRTYPRQSHATVLHTSVSKILKCLQNIIKIYCAVQELRAFSLKYRDRPNWCSAKPHHHFAYQWLENVKIDKYAKFDPNIPCSSRVMSILTNWQQPTQTLVCQKRMLVVRYCWHAFVRNIWLKYTMWYKSYEHFHYLTKDGLT